MTALKPSPKKNILEYFPRGKTPRPGQEETLLRIQERWEAADVFVIEAPTAFGKTAVSETLLRWAQAQRLSSILTVPTNLLVDQAKASFPGLLHLKKRYEYTCQNSTPSTPVNCQETAKLCGNPCKGCPYTADLRKARVYPFQVANYYSYMAHKLYKDVLVVDEAHLLLGMIRDLAAKKLWYHEYKYPARVKTYAQLVEWVNQETEWRPQDKKFQALKADLLSGAHRYLIQAGEDSYHGQQKPLLKMLPIDTSTQPPLLWPAGKVRKVVLMSATVGAKDVEQMGLSGRRVEWIRGDSPIDAHRRPVVFRPRVTVNASSSPDEMAKLTELIRQVLDRHKGQKGLIHAPYALASRLRSLLQEFSSHHSRLIFHDSLNKHERFQEFTKREDDTVLVCSGLYEGIDLPYDAGRFQIIAKVPWANLGEPSVKYLAETDSARYAWDAAKLVMQGAGRICRTPTDLGVTYLFDRSFARIPRELLPHWFLSGLEAGSGYPFD